MSIELVIAVILVLNTIACLWYLAWQSQQVERRAIEREQRFLKIIKDLQNRITAKDITGYMALRSAEDETPQPPSFGRSDYDEAQIEAIQRGIAPQRQQNGQ